MRIETRFDTTFDSIVPTRWLKGSFSPQSLFSQGEQGGWYDPSDLTYDKIAWALANPGFTSAQFLAQFPTHTLFQTADGTPVTNLGQAVGLILDKSRGAGSIGSTVITNGTFTTDTNWTKGTGWTIGSGVATKTAGTASLLSQDVTLVAGQRYILRYVLTRTAGSIQAQLTGGTTVSGISRASGGTFVEYLTAVSGNTTFQFSADASFAGTVDNVTLLSVPAGNHLVQTTALSRPTLDARVNLLTYSEELDNAAWITSNTSVTANQGIAPNGTMTADLLESNTTNAGHFISRNGNVNIIAGVTYTFSVYLKKGSGATAPDIMQLSFTGAAFGSVQYANFNITAGTVGTTAGGIVASISDTGSGWFRCVVTAVATTSVTASSAVVIIFTNNNDSLGRGPSYVDATTSNVLVWGAQLELGSTATTYQSVTTATDYSDINSVRYLTFDGSDDWLRTVESGNINFSANDEMSLFAGFRTLADGANQILAELSNDLNSNNSVFAHFKNASNSIVYQSKGTSTASASSTAILAPAINVYTGLSKISTPVSTLRVNGVQVANTTTTQGTGNYGNFPLFIGRRGGTSLAFNGRLHQLIIRGLSTNISTVQATEKWVASKTGITI